MYKENEKNNKKNKDIYFNEIIENINEENEVYGKNIINLELDIDLKENENIIFNQNENNKREIKDNVNAFLGNKRINIINEENKWKIDYKFIKKGKYNLKLLFKNKLKDINSLFEKCSNIYSIDLSNFDTSKVNDMGWMFYNCHKLKEIKGINKFNSNQVTKMNSMFQQCNELEYLDLSNFDTSKVNDMGFMFNHCHKLKEIKGINKFNTNQVTKMKAMFQECNELEYLDLSNFDTSKVNDMGWMFNKCHKLKFLNLLNFSLNNECLTTNIFKYIKNNECQFLTKDLNLKNLYQQNN